MADGKTFTIVGNDLSDGYHTFDELYRHRHELFIALCRAHVHNSHVSLVWRSMQHADGSMYYGWFILGIGTRPGEQITYHLPIDEYWDVTDFAGTLNRAPEYDGHTSADVLERLRRLS